MLSRVQETCTSLDINVCRSSATVGGITFILFMRSVLLITASSKLLFHFFKVFLETFTN